MLCIVKGVVDGGTQNRVVAAIAHALNLGEVVIGVRKGIFGPSLQHIRAKNKTLVVGLGAVDIYRVVAVQVEIMRRVHRQQPWLHQRRARQKMIVLLIVGVRDIMEIVKIGSDFCRARRIENMSIIEVAYILGERVIRDRNRTDHLPHIVRHRLVRVTGIVPLADAAERHGEDCADSVRTIYIPVITQFEGKTLRLNIHQRTAILLQGHPVETILGHIGEVDTYLLRLLSQLHKHIRLLRAEVHIGIDTLLHKELGSARTVLEFADKTHSSRFDRERPIQSLREVMLGADIHYAPLPFGIIFGRGVGDHLNSVYIRAVCALQQGFQTLAIQMRRAAVNPHRHRLPVQQHIALPVYTHTRCLPQQVERTAPLRENTFRHIHHQLVHLLLHNRGAVHHLHSLQHLGVGLQCNRGQLRLLPFHLQRYRHSAIAYKRGRQHILSTFRHFEMEITHLIGHRSRHHRAVHCHQHHRGKWQRRAVTLVHNRPLHPRLSLANAHQPYHQQQ